MSKVKYVETRRFRSIKSSGAINRVRWIKETDVLRTMSVFIIREAMWYRSLRNGKRSSRDGNMTPPSSLLLASQSYNVTTWGAIYMRHRGLRCHITSLMTRNEMVLETSVSFIHLKRLIAREDSIESCCRESFRSQTYTSYISLCPHSVMQSIADTNSYRMSFDLFSYKCSYADISGKQVRF
jgi:hypothetical protein